jgi:spore coat protein U-like protein
MKEKMDACRKEKKGVSTMGNALRMLLFLSIVFCTAEGFAFNCGVTTTPVNFINYDVFSLTPAYSTGIVAVSCSSPDRHPLPVNISINSGGSGTFNPRQMRAATGTDRLNYYLFTNASRTVIWGDGTSGTSTVTNMVTRNVPWNATIFGMLPPRQNLSAGSYSDTLLVTVSW